MLASAVIEIDAAARRRFVYRADPVNDDNWRSHADDVMADQQWFGDCDDLASTVLDLAGRQGAPLSTRYRLLVAAEGNQTANHMVAAIRCDDGQWMVVGDTFGPAYPAEEMEHAGGDYALDKGTSNARFLGMNFRAY